MIWMYVGFVVLVLALLALDLGVFAITAGVGASLFAGHREARSAAA